MSYFLMAQAPVKQKEVGLVFSSLNNFGLTYKTGTDKSLWRFNTLLLSGRNIEYVADSSENTQNSMGFEVKVGKEYRKILAENFELRYGADLSFNYSYSKYVDATTSVNGFERLREETTYRPGVNLVLGLNYLISDKLVIGAEILPYFTYSTGTSKEKNTYSNSDEEIIKDISGFNYGLSTSSVMLSLVYRF